MIDALVLEMPSLQKVKIEPVNLPLRGASFQPEASQTQQVILYCHSACAFYAQAEQGLITDTAVATGLPVFAFDYPLTPENPSPAQLEVALAAYDWLMESGH